MLQSEADEALASGMPDQDALRHGLHSSSLGTASISDHAHSFPFSGHPGLTDSQDHVATASLLARLGRLC